MKRGVGGSRIVGVGVDADEAALRVVIDRAPSALLAAAAPSLRRAERRVTGGPWLSQGSPLFKQLPAQIITNYKTTSI